jgi:Mg2+-importing ATPase
MKLLTRFMLTFGPVSSLFDFVTFGLLLWIFHAHEALFQTGWFIESLVTQALVIFVIRTRGPAWRSAPSRVLLIASIAVACVAVLLPYAPIAALVGFVPPPPQLLLLVALLTAAYLLAVELLKRWFYARVAPS